MRTHAGRRLLASGAVALLVFAVPLLSACSPRVVFTVTSVLDGVDAHPGDGVCATASGACTLRAAVQEANRSALPVTINLPQATSCCGLSLLLSIPGADEDGSATGDLDVTGNITIVGQVPTPNINGTFIVGTGLDRIFDVQSGGSLTLDRVGVSGGAALTGGGIRVRSGGSAQVNDSWINSNEATESLVCGNDNVCGPVTGGGGIMNSGTLTVNRSQIAGNRSGITAGGCNFPFPVGSPAVPVSRSISGESFCVTAVGGGISSAGKLAVVNSSIIGNQAGPGGVFSGAGGGIFTRQGTPSTTLAFTTIVDNIAGSGQAVAGSFSMSASILGGIPNGDACATFYPGLGGSTITSLDYNIVSDEFCYLRQPHDHQSVDPQLVRLFQAGYDTRIPVAGSLALDAIPAGTPKLCDGTLPVDLRGTHRPSGSGCDIGAVERQPTDP